jgi:hypothetical protein
MRKATLRIAGLLLTLAALASGASMAQPVDPICPFCIIGYKCCIQGSQAHCIPESRPCN